MAERVLTLRELNRATLARQLLLRRKRLSPTGVIEHLVGMQAQSPQAPYIGIWTRATSFRRASLERLLVQRGVLRATMLRLTLHFVTPRDYAVIRSALSGRNFPWESAGAKRLAPSMRTLAAGGAVTADEALAYLEQEHGLTGIEARYAWRYARVAGHVLHHPDASLWQGQNNGRFAAIDEPDAHDPLEARVEVLRRYLAAFGPASRRDMVAWSMMRAPAIQTALDMLELRRFRDENGVELFDVPGAPLPDAEVPGTGPLPAEVGQRAALVRRPDARSPGGAPKDGDQDERGRRPDVPRRRVRRGHVARRRRAGGCGAVRAAVARGQSRGRGRGRAAQSLALIPASPRSVCAGWSVKSP